VKALYRSVAFPFVFAAQIARASAGATDAGASAAVAAVSDTCTELVSEGAVRPTLKESLSTAAIAGYELRLSVQVTHGPGEAVMPDGLVLQEDARFVKALKATGLALASREGLTSSLVAPPVVEGDQKMTRVEFVLLPLPERSGRQNVTVPALPIVVRRASGSQMIVCTAPHAVVVEDPTSNIAEAAARPNPPPRPQREPWLLAKIVAWTLFAAVFSFATGWVVRAWWRKRPKPLPPPAPPRPAWEIALEKLRLIEGEALLRDGKFVIHHDRVTDVVREFLGTRFGFDGLECTTAELLARLQHRGEAAPHLAKVRSFLEDADLIKFAKMTPTKELCERVLADAHHFVRALSPQGDAHATSQVPS
jgi:hypothetical protein